MNFKQRYELSTEGFFDGIADIFRSSGVSINITADIGIALLRQILTNTLKHVHDVKELKKIQQDISKIVTIINRGGSVKKQYPEYSEELFKKINTDGETPKLEDILKNIVKNGGEFDTNESRFLNSYYDTYTKSKNITYYRVKDAIHLFEVLAKLKSKNFTTDKDIIREVDKIFSVLRSRAYVHEVFYWKSEEDNKLVTIKI